jgi:hypothetical protein
VPKVAGLAELIGIRDTLRRENLFNTWPGRNCTISSPSTGCTRWCRTTLTSGRPATMRRRERGVPRYCEFPRLLHLPVPQTFDEVTSNKVWAKQLHDVCDGKIADLDLLPGVPAEDRPRHAADHRQHDALGTGPPLPGP